MGRYDGGRFVDVYFVYGIWSRFRIYLLMICLFIWFFGFVVLFNVFVFIWFFIIVIYGCFVIWKI